MTLRIISPSGIHFEGTTTSLNAKTKSGEVTILDHHRPIISVLTSGTLVYILENGKTQTLSVTSGLLEMNDKNELSVLID